MDPYLERHWRDVHQALVTYARDALNQQLPQDLIARTEERVAVEAASDLVHVIYPDVRVVETATESAEERVSGVSVAQPIVLEVDAEQATEGYVVIIDPAGKLVTVLEFLSPSNKTGEGLADYLRKRKELLSAGVNVVEIDLVRKGDWLALIKPKLAPAELRTTYRAMVRRATTPRRLEYFPIALFDPLPTIPVPLRKSDADAALDLRELLDKAYRNGRYERLDYAADCDPPLNAQDAQSADKLIRESGRR